MDSHLSSGWNLAETFVRSSASLKSKYRGKTREREITDSLVSLIWRQDLTSLSPDGRERQTKIRTNSWEGKTCRIYIARGIFSTRCPWATWQERRSEDKLSCASSAPDDNDLSLFEKKRRKTKNEINAEVKTKKMNSSWHLSHWPLPSRIQTARDRCVQELQERNRLTENAQFYQFENYTLNVSL